MSVSEAAVMYFVAANVWLATGQILNKPFPVILGMAYLGMFIWHVN